MATSLVLKLSWQISFIMIKYAIYYDKVLERNSFNNVYGMLYFSNTYIITYAIMKLFYDAMFLRALMSLHNCLAIKKKVHIPANKPIFWHIKFNNFFLVKIIF